MTPKAIHDRLADELGIEIEWHAGTPGDPFCTVLPERWHDTCGLACHDPQLFFDFLRAQTGVDYPEDGAIEVVVHLFSYKHRHGLVLKTRVDREDPRLDTVEDIWPAANWYEREIYDLLGVHFNGHPDLRRLVLPQDWIGHPLRKDYREQEAYRGIPTTRPGYPKPEPRPSKKAGPKGSEAKTARSGESAPKKTAAVEGVPKPTKAGAAEKTTAVQAEPTPSRDKGPTTPTDSGADDGGEAK